MSDNIITVENLSKSYRIGTPNSDDGLRHRLEGMFRNPLRTLRAKYSAQTHEKEFWALRDVSFEIKQGDVVGIIGRNGAGKSTLLKILSRITQPTTGRIHLKGRISSLLEVGTGFHPELTGRENIFLNGAILGMTREEIRRKFDEIVAFSEVEEFLDTPVKRYSSGMYVRLAFSVAAHLEPEILIVDEVLAVGDDQFQKKCLGRMENVASEGRTVLFVSHNMVAVRSLCSKGILFDKGRIETIGEISQVVGSYLSEGIEHSGSWVREKSESSEKDIFFEEVRILNAAGEISSRSDCRETFTLQIRLRSKGTFDNAQIAVRFTNADGIAVFTTCNTDKQRRFVSIEPGSHTFSVTVPGNLLAPGTYTLILAVHIPRHQLFDLIENSLAVSIGETASVTGVTNDHRFGVVNPILEWTKDSAISGKRTSERAVISG